MNDSASPAALDGHTGVTSAQPTTRSESHRWDAWLLLPSGCAALIYQVVWVRLLGLSMGSTSAAISTILTAFFLGITLGSLLAGSVARRHARPLLAFAWLELLIGGSALLLLPVLLQLDQVIAWLGEFGSLLPLKFLLSLLLLALPTICMGATFPVFASALVRDQTAMSSALGKLYAVNTAGAVLGALLCGFVLIPWVGLDGAVLVAGALNLLTAALAWALGSRQGRVTPADVVEVDAVQAESTACATASTMDRSPSQAGLVLFSTGLLSIAAEVGWTKYLSIVTGATVYGFAAILGLFLAGIALGSGVSRRLLHRHTADWKTLIWGLIGFAATLLLARLGLASMPTLLGQVDQLSGEDGSVPLGRYALALATLFPATYCLGALFPISVSLYCGDVLALPKRVGRAYAINTLGSILGAVIAGFWIIPRFGTAILLDLLILGALLLPLWLTRGQNWRLLAVIVALGVATLTTPNIDYSRLIAANPYRFDHDAASGKQPEFLYLEEGKAGVISLITYDHKSARLQDNGIQESYVPMVDGVKPPFTEMLLGILPPLLHPAPKTAFVVGFGGGNTLKALTLSKLQKIKVVELEPAIVRAVAVAQGGAIPMLQDPRVELVYNDARNELLVHRNRYDLIVSQPSHPWLAGAGNLFTRDFFGIVSNRLNPGGIYAQWVNLFNMDATTLRSIFAAFYEVFPQGFALANTASGDLILLGSNLPIQFDYERMAAAMTNPGIQSVLATAKVQRPEDLLWYFALSREEALNAAAGMAANTDTRILTEVRLAGLHRDVEGMENPYQLLQRHETFDVLKLLKPEEAAMVLYRAGHYFYRFNAVTRTRQAIQRLRSIDPSLADRLQADWAAWKQALRRASGSSP